MAGVEGIADERQVPNLAGGSVRAANELVVDDDPHPDSGADGDEYHRLDAPGQTEPFLAHRGQIDVVLDEHGQVEPVADDLERIEPPLGGHVIGQRCHPAAGLIDNPGRGDTESQGPAVDGAGVVDDLADHLEDLRPDGSTAVLGGRLLQIANGLAEQIGRGNPDIASPDVATHDEPDSGADHV